MNVSTIIPVILLAIVSLYGVLFVRDSSRFMKKEFNNKKSIIIERKLTEVFLPNGRHFEFGSKE